MWKSHSKCNHTEQHALTDRHENFGCVSNCDVFARSRTLERIMHRFSCVFFLTLATTPLSCSLHSITCSFSLQICTPAGINYKQILQHTWRRRAQSTRNFKFHNLSQITGWTNHFHCSCLSDSKVQIYKHNLWNPSTSGVHLLLKSTWQCRNCQGMKCTWS